MSAHFRHLTFKFGCAAVFLIAAFAFLCPDAASQDQDTKIVVDGAPLVTSQPIVRRGGEWQVPLLEIAQALAADIQISPDRQTITVRRANGVEYTFNTVTGEIRNRYVLIGKIAPNLTQSRGLNDALIFPLSGIVALLGVSVEEDLARNTVVIQSNRDGIGGATADAAGGTFHMVEMKDNYAFRTNGHQSDQTAAVGGQGLFGRVPLRGSLETIKVAGRPTPRLSQASLRADLNPQKVILLGDQSTYSGLDALIAPVRGVGLESRLGGFSSYYYGGRGRGSTATTSLGGSGISNYDTSLGGMVFRRKNRGTELDFAGESFRGPLRSGDIAGSALSMANVRNQFKVQTAVGHFSGLSAVGPVNGIGYGFSVVDTYSPVKTVSITAQSERYSKNFLTVTDDHRFNDQTSNGLRLLLHPLAPISLTGGVTDRQSAGTPASHGYDFGTQYLLPVHSPVILSFQRSNSEDTVLGTAGMFRQTQYSLMIPSMNHYSISSFYSEINTGTSISRDVSVFAARSSRLGQLEFHDQLRFGQMNNYGADLLMNPPLRDGQILVGIDKLGSLAGKSSFAPRVSLRLPFFGGQSLQVTYTAESGKPLLQLQLTGPIIRRREVQMGLGGDNIIVRNANLKGRVYFDVNNDGHYDELTDKPVVGLAIWLDDTTRITTDGTGTFHFTPVHPGAHRLKVDLSGVPADLALIDNTERTVAVAPYQENIQNFRVLQMARITGKVTYLDYTEDEDNPVERPLPDARITVGPNLDTYSESNGLFIVGDLIPGEYELTVDPSSIPEGYVAKPASISISAKPGQTEDRPRFLVSRALRAVIEKKLAAQDVAVQPAVPQKPSQAASAPAVTPPAPAPVPPTPVHVPAVNKTVEAYTVQVGVFGKLENAEAVAARLRKKYSDVTIEKAEQGTVVYKVRVGHFADTAAAREFEKQLASEGFEKPGIVSTAAPAAKTAPTGEVAASRPAKAVVVASPVVPPPSPLIPATGAYTVQVGVFGSLANAEALAGRLDKKYDSVVIQKSSAGGTLYHVQVGRFSDMRAAREVEKKLAGEGLVTYVVKVE